MVVVSATGAGPVAGGSAAGVVLEGRRASTAARAPESPMAAALGCVWVLVAGHRTSMPGGSAQLALWAFVLEYCLVVAEAAFHVEY